MFCYKSTRQQLIEERQKNEVLTAQLIKVTDALVEIAGLTAVHEDALVELADIITDIEGVK